jgi:hypothetical protein
MSLGLNVGFIVECRRGSRVSDYSDDARDGKEHLLTLARGK